jgi:hypothetical protein
MVGKKAVELLGYMYTGAGLSLHRKKEKAEFALENCNESGRILDELMEVSPQV